MLRQTYTDIHFYSVLPDSDKELLRIKGHYPVISDPDWTLPEAPQAERDQVWSKERRLERQLLDDWIELGSKRSLRTADVSQLQQQEQQRWTLKKQQQQLPPKLQPRLPQQHKRKIMECTKSSGDLCGCRSCVQAAWSNPFETKYTTSISLSGWEAAIEEDDESPKKKIKTSEEPAWYKEVVMDW
jgi:hypothetical protein